MDRVIRLACVLAFALLGLGATDQRIGGYRIVLPQPATAANPIPSSRLYDWTYTGVPGGIPTTRTRCTTGTGTSVLASSSTAAQINTAITGCDANHFVELGSGTFTLTAEVVLKTNNVTLKGQGAGSTILSRTGRIINMENSEASVVSGRAITGGGTKGSFTITVADTTNLPVGRMFQVTRDDDTTYVQSSLATRGKARQINIITAVNGTTLTVRNPWVVDFSTGNPEIEFGYSANKTGIGLEDMALDHNGATGSATIHPWFCDSCWIKGVKIQELDSYNIVLMGVLNFEIRDSYIAGAGGTGSNGGGVVFDGNGTFGYNSNCKLENTIIDNTFPALEVNNSQATAILYVYVHGNPAAIGLTHSLDDSHAQLTLCSLYEGNISETWGQDGFHGGSACATAFRNWITGYNPNTPDSGDAVQIKRLGYYANVVANVIGHTLVDPNGYDSGCGNELIFQLGYPNIGNCNTTQSGSGAVTSGLTYPDALVISTLMRWGNYDTFNDATRWESSEIPSGVSVPSSHALPNSQVYTSQPAFLSGYPWPLIGPDVSGGDTGPASKVNRNAAKKCWDTQSLPGGTFDRATCYP